MADQDRTGRRGLGDRRSPDLDRGDAEAVPRDSGSVERTARAPASASGDPAEAPAPEVAKPDHVAAPTDVLVGGDPALLDAAAPGQPAHPGGVDDGLDDLAGALAERGPDLDEFGLGDAGLGTDDFDLDGGHGPDDPASAREAALDMAGDTGGGGPAPVAYPKMKAGSKPETGSGGGGVGTSQGDEAGTIKGVASPRNMSTVMEGAATKVTAEGDEVVSLDPGPPEGAGTEGSGTEGSGTEGSGGAEPEGEPPPEEGTAPAEDQLPPGEGGGFGTGAGPDVHIDVNEFKDAPHTGWGDGRTDPPPESDGITHGDDVPIVDESIAWDVDPDAPLVDDLAVEAPEPDSGDIDWGDGE